MGFAYPLNLVPVVCVERLGLSSFALGGNAGSLLMKILWLVPVSL